jgi:chromosome partitioning protein
MRTIALISQKGGSGKSTLTVHLAAMAKNSRIIDLDPQGSSLFWFNQRKADTPSLVSCGWRDLATALAQASRSGIEWAFVDTAPRHDGVAAAAILRASDLALVPMRPSAFDLAATSQSIETANKLAWPYAVVLNACPVGRGIAEGSLTVSAKRALDALGAPYMASMISQRVALSHAIISGLAVTEFDPAGKASLEMRMLWMEIQDRLEDGKDSSGRHSPSH